MEVGNGEFTMVQSLMATPFDKDSFRVEFNLGFVNGSEGCSALNYWTSQFDDSNNRELYIYEDPERYLGTNQYQGALTYWGWK